MFKASMLNLRDAIKLYSLLKDFIPEELPNKLYDFAGTILKNINVSDRPENFGEALILMTGNTVLKLDKLDSVDRIELFLEGLQKNKFLTLTEFCKELGL